MPRFAANLTMDHRASVSRSFRRRRQRRVRGGGVSIPLFLRRPEDWDAGERGIACHPERVVEFRAGVAAGIEHARALGVGQLNCLAGKALADQKGQLQRPKVKALSAESEFYSLAF